MYGQNALGVSSRTEGVPVSGVYYNRASSLVPASEIGLRAGAGGVSIGLFGWADEAGNVLNSRTSASDARGLVVIQGGDWRRVFWDEVSCTWKIREGMNLTMLSGGPGIWVRLANGGAWGQRIYADPANGRVIAGAAVGLEATPWTLVTPSGAGGRAFITTWNTPQ